MIFILVSFSVVDGSYSSKLLHPCRLIMPCVVLVCFSDGSVNAPGWVLPVGAFAVIVTAALPILLRPGEEALEQQRIDEDAPRSSVKDINK